MGQFLPEEILELQEYKAKNRIRILTATALFDGHDASINIMRRLLQSRGAEIIHLGHNRSALEIVHAALQEDVHAIAISSYQGGHNEFFKYVKDLLVSFGAEDVQIYGGGGGVITPKEISALHQHGINRIFSPEDGQNLGLTGIIGYILKQCDFNFESWGNRNKNKNSALGRAITLIEQNKEDWESSAKKLLEAGYIKASTKKIPVLGVTGTGGAGKSSLTDELISRFLFDSKHISIAVVCVDPSKRKTGGALLGDRIRMNSISDERVFLRSLATRGSGSELAAATKDVLKFLDHFAFDLIIVETSGIGQGDAEILKISDISMYVMTPEYGASTQLEKIDMLDFADIVAINKFERKQALDAIRDVRHQIRRSRFQGQNKKDVEYPVFGTIASRFADDGVNGLYKFLCQKLNEKVGAQIFKCAANRRYAMESTHRQSLIAGDRQNYLGEISKSIRNFHRKNNHVLDLVENWEAMARSEKLISDGSARKELESERVKMEIMIPKELKNSLDHWQETYENFNADDFTYSVRGKDVKVKANFETLSQKKYPKVALPPYRSKREIARYLLKENIPGFFPFTAGIFPFRRVAEDPKRQFAGEGGPKRTNARFHFLSKNDEAKRLSTAFDSVTLYGAEPEKRPDIYGKVGESGVSIAHLEDMQDLYRGFDLCAENTSVSMTINGPAPILLAMFMNTAFLQQIDKFKIANKREPDSLERSEILSDCLSRVRGTVQADILKEDQAQNTCIFSTEFALKMMADIQEYFIKNKVRNYYSVSISGYHIAEAGANPITQLAFTLANGFTYVEYYLARGMAIDDFAPNLSFFFSNGIDTEYAVLGRVARRIWAVAMRDVYHANERSQKLKYHIQTSGRSLHAQEIDFNDIRTTLQALIALYDNCNSLHTNAYDEAITTPTEESVRRAMAIQMIINKEFGLNKCENLNQGSYFLDLLTDAVEAAVLEEFDRINERGGVLGAMELQYQRNKIQEESLYYESLKDSGVLPVVGVNTFQNPKVLTGSYVRPEIELIRASYAEKDDQLQRLGGFKNKDPELKLKLLKRLQDTVINEGNIFEQLMECVQYASLGEITSALYEVGGQYRRAL